MDIECTTARGLTGAERALVDRARQLADLTGPGLREHAGVQDPAMAMAAVLGECQHVLRELAILVLRRSLPG